MNRHILTAWTFVLATCTPVMAYADDPVTDAGRELGENVSVRPVWITILMVLTWGLTRLAKDPSTPGVVAPRWRPLLALGLALTIGALESLVRHGLTWPAFTEGLQTGFLAAGGAIFLLQDVIVFSILGRKTEPPPSPPPMPGATTTTTTIITGALMCLTLCLVGCTGDPLVDAATAHKFAATTVNDAGEILERECVDPMEKLGDEAQSLRRVEEAKAVDGAPVMSNSPGTPAKSRLAQIADEARALDTTCAKPVDLYDIAQASVSVLGAALVAAALDDLARLPAALASVKEAVVNLSQAVGQVVLK